MRAFDVYEQVKPGTRYPAMLVAVGMNDARVPPWQGAKLVAKLRAECPAGGPYLLRVDDEGGHVGETQRQLAAERADEYAFFLWQFGLARGS